MRKTLLMFLSFFALASVAVFFSPKAANAYPGFARKYNFPCSFCHIQWPRLADTGHFFKDRGFMLSTTGKGNGLDMMFQDPKNQNYFPIGFHMEMAYGGSAVNGYNPTSSLNGGTAAGRYGNSPVGNGGWSSGAGANTVWDIESGGLLNPWISFWVQPGGGAAGGSAGPGFGIVKLWVRFDDLLNTTWLNVYVGKTSLDTPVSNQRALTIGQGSPFTMYDYQPGVPEIANNAGSAGGMPVPAVGLFYDADGTEFNNDVTSIRYFGYHINSGAACSTQSAFSIDPCETRLSVSFIPNAGLYGSGPADGVPGAFAAGIPSGYQNCPAGGPCSSALVNNGFSYFAHLTQSFGGWGRTNGERIGFFALVGEGTAPGGSNSNPTVTYNREGVDFMINPLPNGRLNIDGAWDIATDPTGAIASPGLGSTTSGEQYMSWWVTVNWQPTFGGFFSQSGTNSNLIELNYNQLVNTQQPTFSSLPGGLPGNFNNVMAFALTDRYWLWGSDRADISLFAEYQYMVNYGVAGTLSAFANGQSTAVSAADTRASGFFGNVEANNFTVGLDFAY